MSTRSQSAGKKSRAAKKAQRKRKLASAAPAQLTKRDSVSSMPPPSLTASPIQTRRSSLRSCSSAPVTSEARSAVSSDVRSFSPKKPDAGVPQPRASVVAVLAQHIRQSVRFWSSKSTAVDAAAAIMSSQPCSLDVIDAIVQVSACVYYLMLSPNLCTKNAQHMPHIMTL